MSFSRPRSVEVLDQGRQSQIEQRQGLRGIREEVFVPVPVVVALEHPPEGPAAERQRDAAGARFDHPPGQQELVQQRLSLALVRIAAIQPITAAGRRPSSRLRSSASARRGEVSTSKACC